MKTDAFDYGLPDSAIAQRPLPRGESRMLVLSATGTERHRHVRDLPKLLRPGDLLVVNDTRVIPSRLFGRRQPGGGRAEALLLEPAEGDGGRDGWVWEALVRPGRKLRPGVEIVFGPANQPPGAVRSDEDEHPEDGHEAAASDGGPSLRAVVAGRLEDGRALLRFEEDPLPRLAELGHVPLPPYIRRHDDAADQERYQTVFARENGAVAAPTAGLHFDDALLGAIEAAGVARVAVTLHVGIGTFKPVDVEDVDTHVMERERYRVPEGVARAIAETRARGGRVVAVGTTVVRTLESAARATGKVEAGAGTTELFIRPGFPFRVVDVLLTNFHLPRSTLLMLVSALAGKGDQGRERVLAGYREALEAGYRFFSYGDAMLIERAVGTPGAQTRDP